MFRKPRVRDKTYLGLIAQLPSVVSGGYPVHVCHVRYGDPARGKPHTGMGEKPSDCWTLPLTPMEHQLSQDAQHRSGEREWWARRHLDPVAICIALHGAYVSAGIDALEDMRSIIMRARMLR